MEIGRYGRRSRERSQVSPQPVAAHSTGHPPRFQPFAEVSRLVIWEDHPPDLIDVLPDLGEHRVYQGIAAVGVPTGAEDDVARGGFAADEPERLGVHHRRTGQVGKQAHVCNQVGLNLAGLVRV